MKKMLFGLIATVMYGLMGNAQETLILIKEDIKNEKFYLEENNKYDYNSEKFLSFLETNQSVFENKTSSQKDYKDSLIKFFQDENNNSIDLNKKFDSSLFQIDTNDNYFQLLDSSVKDGVITDEQKTIIVEYLNYFFNENNNDNFVKINTVFIYHINNSKFSEQHKKGLLTVFSSFSIIKKLQLGDPNQYKFLNLIVKDSSVLGKSKSTVCAGNMLIGMLGGSLGGPAGFAAGFIGGIWECWKDGCFN